jgi:hypothetical protein
LQYKKAETDGAMPKEVGPLRAKCLEVMHRVSLKASPHPSDDEASMIEDPDSGDGLVLGELM